MTQTLSNEESNPPAADAKADTRWVYPGMGLLFAVVVGCFTAWGIAADLTTPMVAGFKRIFDMSTFQASLVQLAYFGAYFLLALPAAFINERFGYKAGLLTGLGLAAAGAFLFYPASKIMTYEAFLVALFALAAGCSILETSANPYVISLGPEETATRRLNFAQAFNPLGTNIGVLLAATLILPKLETPGRPGLRDARAGASHPSRAARRGDGSLPRAGPAAGGDLDRRSRSRRRRRSSRSSPTRATRAKGALSACCGGTSATASVWSRSSSTWRLRCAPGPTSSSTSSRPSTAVLPLGGYLLQVSLIIFLISRFVMTWVIGKIRPPRCSPPSARWRCCCACSPWSSPNLAGVIAVVGVSFCLSLMFPTIYGVALRVSGRRPSSAPPGW